MRLYGSKNVYWAWLWILNVLIIFVLCIWGRPIQHWVQDKIALVWVGYAVIAVLAAAVIYLVVRQIRFKPGPGIIISGLIAAGILAFTFNAGRPEEKLHLLMFGALGFISIRVFGFWKGLCVCLAVGGLDELLQLYLPSRVGDFQDVGMNSAAGIAGVLIGRFSGNKFVRGYDKYASQNSYE